ncbi:FAD/NAD-P-binding domain-containing protein [Pholiota conissans]|uniref:FAD/NAD-P-binding domain-containing protein n=1 Tax=Pholiota conissans TaxID=109636 RepID=A0A9P6CVS8_9AGAR|nr:FAD/NAD-P-binding domain-containing protein [Pholiota conissans]
MTNTGPGPVAGIKLRIAICGGGIGGLCLAVSLSRYAHLDINVYESAGQFREIGAGVMIWARTWHILEKMGLASEFSKIAHAPPTGAQGVGFDYRRSDQPCEGFRFKLVEMPYGVCFSIHNRHAVLTSDSLCQCIRFHRAEFLDVFVNHLPPGIAHFGKRLTSYSRNSNGLISLIFNDSSSAICDVLIGADGIKSTIRAQMYREAADTAHDQSLMRYIEPVWTGTMAYRGLVRVQDIPRNKDGSPHRTIGVPMMYCGKGRHVVSYSISQGDIVNIVTFVSQPEKHGQHYDGEWVTNCDKQELLDCYANWEPEVGSLLKCIDKPTRWAIHHVNPLPFYHKDGVVLMGDAAHAMSPHQGAGAGQAIEDGFVLGHLLANITSKMQLFRSLDAYEAIRLPTANSVVNGSYESGMMYDLISKYGDDYATLGPAIQRQWKWINEISLETELEFASRLARSPSPNAKL